MRAKLALGWLSLSLLGISLTAVSNSAHATPWADSDDLQVRHNLQILADAGVVNLSVSTYPLMWGALIEVLQGVDTRALRQHERNAYLQVMAALEFHQQGGYTGGRMSAQSDTNAERGFGQRLHEKGALEITRELKGEHTAFRLQTAWRGGQEIYFGREDKQEFSLAGSYLATVVTSDTLGSWVFSLDQLYTWWSPSYENDGMHTRSVQPLHALRVTRAGSAPSRMAALAWLGPWSATAYVGRSERLVGVPELLLGDFQAGQSITLASERELDPGLREEAFGIRFTANPHRALQLGARFTGAHLNETSKNAALDARIVMPNQWTTGQFAIYGELITHRADTKETFHTLGADYSFAFGGAERSWFSGAGVTNARVYGEHLNHREKETTALGYSQFTNSGFGLDVRIRNIRYQANYYGRIEWQDLAVQQTNSYILLADRLANYLAEGQERQQADITVYLPLRGGRLSAGVQAWRDSYSAGAGASSALSDDSSRFNVFLNWEIRW